MRAEEGRTWWLGVLAVTIGLLGCAPAEDSAATPDSDAAAADTDTPTPVERAAPSLDPAEIWASLADADYQSWDLWPGKGRLYAGVEPHGMLLTTYLNPTAARALAVGATIMPPGAIIVKENYMPDGTLAAITTMHKVEGFNPEAGDWHWVKYLPDGSVDGDGAMHGKVPGCIACHGGKRDNDYIFTAELGDG